MSRIGPSAVPLRHSLRGKGLAALVAGLLYLLGSVTYVSWVRAHLYDDMQALERLAQHERVLVLTETAVDNAEFDANEASSAAVDPPPSRKTSLARRKRSFPSRSES